MATQAQVDTLARDVAANLGALEALRSVQRDIQRLQLGAPADSKLNLQRWIAYKNVLAVLEKRMGDLEAEGRQLDSRFFQWFAEDVAASLGRH